MPVFTFEKISPPVRRSSNPSLSNPSSESRGLIVQMLDRFVGVRVRRPVSVDSLRVDRGVIPGPKAKLPE